MARRFVEERWAFWARSDCGLGAQSRSIYTCYRHGLTRIPYSRPHSSSGIGCEHAARARVAMAEAGPAVGFDGGCLPAQRRFFIAVAYEALSAYAEIWSTGAGRLEMLAKVLRLHGLYGLGILLALLPTFVTRQIVSETLSAWGRTLFARGIGPLRLLRKCCFPRITGCSCSLPFWSWRLPDSSTPEPGSDRRNDCLLITPVFYCLISCFPWWYGAVGLGNRFFVSLIPIFIFDLPPRSPGPRGFGLTCGRPRPADPNHTSLCHLESRLGLQWQTHLMPRYGQVDWQDIRFNQFELSRCKLFTI